MKGELSEGEWSDDDEATSGKKGGKKEKSKLGKRKKSEADDEEDKVQNFFTKEVIQEVPADDPGTRMDAGYDSMNSDEVAETRALARKMLRKKTRSEILDSTYNRYSFHEDPNSLPSWFVEDEQKHYWRHHNATKEEVQEEKEEIKAYNSRPSKKVEQAKARKRKRLGKAMEKVKKRAQVVADQDLNENTKMKQIQKMYSKEKKKHEEEKSYVVNRAFNASKGAKVARNVKLVDGRLKKD